MQLENLSNFVVDPLYATYHYSHPPLTERLDAITVEEAKFNGSTPLSSAEASLSSGEASDETSDPSSSPRRRSNRLKEKDE